MVRLNCTYYSLLKSTSKTVWYGLTVHIFSPLKIYKQNFQNYLSQSNSSELRKFAHFVNLFYIMFQAPAPAENPEKFQRITQIPHDSPTQPANHANSAHFAL